MDCFAGRPITKSHDFDLKLPVVDEFKYVVQIRNPALSIPSWFRLNSRKNKNIRVHPKQFWDEKMNIKNCLFTNGLYFLAHE